MNQQQIKILLNIIFYTTLIMHIVYFIKSKVACINGCDNVESYNTFSDDMCYMINKNFHMTCIKTCKRESMRLISYICFGYGIMSYVIDPLSTFLFSFFTL